MPVIAERNQHIHPFHPKDKANMTRHVKVVERNIAQMKNGRLGGTKTLPPAHAHLPIAMGETNVHSPIGLLRKRAATQVCSASSVAII